MFTLPVSRVPVRFGALDGHDDVYLAESVGADFALRVELVRRFAPPDDSAMTWDALPAADVDAALLAARWHLLGDRIVAELKCTACGSLGDVALSVDDYLAAHAPERPEDVLMADDGRFVVEDVRFRVPTVIDLLDATQREASGGDPQDLLDVACIESVVANKVELARRSIERVAPTLGSDIEGACPSCGADVHAFFDPGAFVIAEVRQPAAAVFEHVHLLASSYGWTEDTILALPSVRRARYAEYVANAMRASASYSIVG